MNSSDSISSSEELEDSLPPVNQFAVQRWKAGALTSEHDAVSEEVPIALIYNNIPYAVMLASPQQLKAFAVGFSVSEGIVSEFSELQRIDVSTQKEGIEVRMQIPGNKVSQILQRERNLTGRTGCGICGINDLDAIDSRPICELGGELQLSHEMIPVVVSKLRKHQRLNQLTGSLHGAAWVSQAYEIEHVCEDVGRHNALDKLIGWLLMNRVNLHEGFILVSSRASYEMVQKTGSIGVTALVALSAPTGMGVRLANDAGMTLVGFAAKGHHVVYAHPERFIG